MTVSEMARELGRLGGRKILARKGPAYFSWLSKQRAVCRNQFTTYPRLVSEEEYRSKFVCEHCQRVCPRSPWPKGWYMSGRSRLLIPPDRGCYNAVHCESCSAVDKDWPNPKQGEIDSIRAALKEHPKP